YVGAWAHKHFLQILKKSAKSEVRDRVRVYYRVKPGANELGTHSYIHAKTWIFDDELAVIGSANCNYRGWESDSEEIAAISDKRHSVKDTYVAQTLRMKLWAEHIGVKEDNIRDGILSKDLWPKSDSKVPTSCNVRWYDLSKENESEPGNWSTINLRASELKSCG